jgi:lysophospholipase L1-like esterase
MSFMIRKGGLAALAATLVAAALIGVSPAQAESNGGVRVMPLGDSITDGYNVPGGYRIGLWQSLVSAGYQVDFVGSMFNGPAALGDHDHEGHSGWTISQIDANVNTWLRNSSPRTVLLHIGTNDMYGDTSGAPGRLGTLLDHITAAAPDADVFVATIITSSGRDTPIRNFNAAVPGLVQSRANAGKHVHLVDMYSALTPADLADGIHPNGTGYQKMANAWYSALRAVPGVIGNGPAVTTPPVTGPPATTPSGATPAAGCSATRHMVHERGSSHGSSASAASITACTGS